MNAMALAFVASLLLVSNAMAQDVPGPTVSIQDDEFVPARANVVNEATVSWTNDGANQHTVTSDDGKFDSGLLDPGDTTSLTFAAPGTYPYYCTIHGAPGGVGMSGVITVT